MYAPKSYCKAVELTGKLNSKAPHVLIREWTNDQKPHFPRGPTGDLRALEKGFGMTSLYKNAN